MNKFKVIVPCKPIKVGRKKIHFVSYPPSGYALYTREEAKKILAKFPESVGAWAESKNKRFDLTTC
jgi:hypothetical protein